MLTAIAASFGIGLGGYMAPLVDIEGFVVTLFMLLFVLTTDMRIICHYMRTPERVGKMQSRVA